MNQSFLVYGGIGAAAGGILSAIMVIISGFITEMFLLLLGYSYIEYESNFTSPVYEEVVKRSWGMGYRHCSPETSLVYRYGMVISIRHMWFGYITPNRNTDVYSNVSTTFNLSLWSLRDVSDVIGINILLRAKKQVAVNYYRAGRFRADIPCDSIVMWQRQLSKKIIETQSKRGIVVLLTGHPGCGKTTFPQISAYDMEIAGLNIFTSVDVTNATSHVYDLERKSAYHMCIDEFDDVISKMMNDKQTTGKAPIITLLDNVHMATNPPVLFLISNLTYNQLRIAAGINAESIFRPGRVDIIAHVDNELNLHILREYAPVANKPPQPLSSASKQNHTSMIPGWFNCVDLPMSVSPPPKSVDSDDDTIVLSAES